MGDQTRGEQEKLRYDAYVRHREHLLAGRDEEGRSFDKHILALATGGLALSILFLEKISGPPGRAAVWLLYAAWAFLLLCIVTVLLSFVIGKVAYDKAIAMWDQAFSCDENLADSWRKSASAKWTIRLKQSSLAFFGIGVVLLGLSAGASLATRPAKETSDGQSTQKATTQAAGAEARAKGAPQKGGGPALSPAPAKAP